MTTTNLAELPGEEENVQTITRALAAPFDLSEIKFKPQIVKNNRAFATAYVDARAIQDRLDGVLGVENWQDAYKILPDGSVICRLKMRLGGRWITKMDVGSPSEQPDGGDRLKAAFSDALKRAAVKFGVGRYLYRLPGQWVDYDPVKKQLTRLPQLPAFAQPRNNRRSDEVRPNAAVTETEMAATQYKDKAPPAPRSDPKLENKASPSLPANGEELQRRLKDYESRLVAEKRCSTGALLTSVVEAGAKAGYAANLAAWSGPAIPFAAEAVRRFVQSLPKDSAASKTAA